MQSRETQITMVKWTNAGGQTKRANERSFVYRPPAWQRWRNVKTTYSIFQIKAGRFRKRYCSCNRFANENLSPRLFSNIAPNMQVELSCKLVWLLQNCFLLSISRKWKTIEVLSFSRTVNQFIMRVRKPKVEYKLALQERPKGENLDVLL